jgi:hypothetical protein
MKKVIKMFADKKKGIIFAVAFGKTFIMLMQILKNQPITTNIGVNF